MERSEAMELPEVDFAAIGPDIGEQFPNVLLHNQRGEEINLHRARRGGRALVVFYRSADW